MGCLLWLSYTSIRLAYADFLFREKTLPAMTEAVRLDPANAQYHAWLAELQESAGRDPTAELRAATDLNPRDSFAWMRRGLLAESRSDFAEAERCLLEAARVDRQFDPRWTLMNYYFRRGDLPRFWTWTRRSLEMSYGDRSAIFRLGWRVTEDAEEIRRALPPDPEVLAGFARFLLEQDRIESAAALASRAGDTGLLLSVCEKGLQAGRVAPGLCESTAAFDWHAASDPEVTMTEGHSGWRVTLSGRQAESCELAWKYVPLTPGARYRFRFYAETSGAPSPSGLRWQLASWPDGRMLLGAWDEKERTFSSGNATLGRLALRYQRATGTARMEGTVLVREVAIDVAP